MLGVALVATILAGAETTRAQPRGLPSFPGAEGFGATTPGGRGGRVLHVTTLEDYAANEPRIPGSLRAALEARGPRIVVFEVGGYIELKRKLNISQPYLTLAGQTAPGDGVTLKNYGLDVDAPHVVIRYLRVRPGDTAGTEQDGINVRADSVVIDHSSVSWGTDETLSISGDARDVTLQWCMITESLNRSVHHKGAHGYGTLIAPADRVTIHHSIYAFHRSRNPRPKDVTLDFRNNLVYGYGDKAGYNTGEVSGLNLVGNTLYPLAYSNDKRHLFDVGGTGTRLFVAGNDRLGGLAVEDEWDLIDTPRGVPVERFRSAIPFAAPTVTTDPADVAFARVLNEAGATRPVRDGVDARVVDLIRRGEGRILDAQAEAGGYPPLRGGPAPTDTDRDGMPDAWETRHGFDPASAADGATDRDGDGYTNVEEYLNETDPAVPFRWTAPPVISAPDVIAAGDEAVVRITSSVAGVPVHYTLDGSEPTADSPRYTRPLRLTHGAHVRAKVLVPGATTAAFASIVRLPWHLPSVDAAGRMPGLAYAYYEEADWDEAAPFADRTPLETGVTADLALNPHGKANGYSLRLTGLLDVPRDGVYTFHLGGDTRSRLYINGAYVTRGRRAVPVALRAGLHAVEVYSVHEESGAVTTLEWEGPDLRRQPVPAGRLFHTASAPQS